MGYFRFFFFTLQTFYRPVPYPMRKKKKKLQKSQIRVLLQKTYRGGGAKPPPPPSLYRVKRHTYAYKGVILVFNKFNTD